MNPSNGSRLGSADTKSPEKDFGFSALNALESANSLEGDAVSSTGSLAGKPSETPQADAYMAAKEHALKRRRIIGFSILGLAILIGVILIFVLQSHQKATETQSQDASKRFPTTSIPLAELSKDSNATVINNQVLSVNGQLNVNNALVITPGVKPTAAIAGQLYFDQTTNKLMYYDGTQFQSVAAGSDIPKVTPTSISGASGAIGLGGGLSIAGNTLSNTGVLTLQGQSGNVTLTGGAGLTVNGTTLSNSGILSLGGQSGDIALGSGLSLSGNTLNAASGVASVVGTGNISVIDDGNGNLTIGTTGQPGMGSVTSSGGTVGRIGMFTGVQNIEDSLISQSGGTITVNGNLSVAGSTTLSTPLAVTSGGTGATTAANARVNIGAAKNGANSDITSLSGLTTALSVAQGGSGVGTLSTNGVLVGNGTSPLTAVVAGAAGQCLVSTGGAPTFAACPGAGGVSSLNGGSGALTLNNASLSGSVITINDATTAVKGIASFNSTNFTVSSGAVNTVQNINTTAAPTFGQLSLTSSQATNPMLLLNNTNGAATGNLLDLQLNGSSKLSVAPSGNLTTTGTISSGTINGQTISSSASFTGSVVVGTTLAVNTITPSSSLTIGATGQSFTLQGNASSNLTATNGANVTTVGFQNPTASVTYNFATAAAGAYNICTTAGNCVGVGGGVTSAGGTTNTLAKFTGSTAIGDSIISDNGSTVTIGGALSVNTITPTAALTVGAAGQNLTLQGASVSLSRTSGGVTNSLVFANPASSNKTITIPNATGTVAVSASGPLSLDSLGNLTCPTCLTGGGGGGGVSSLNGLSGALILQSSDAATFSNSGATITVSDASSTVKGVANFNASNLTVTSGTVNTIQNISVTSTPTFAGLNLTSALTVGNGGTGATTAGAARTNLGAAASGANSDITSLSGLTTALSVAQGGTGVATTPTNGQILIGNGTNFSVNTLTAGSGINISNTAGSITISAPSAGSCASCANTALSNLSGVAINTSLLPGTAAGANLGSSVLPFGQLSLAGTSATPATNNFLITGASTGGTRTITLPDASGTIAVSASGNIALSANGNITFTGQLPVANGGTGSNSASGARTNLGAAASGANSDITSLNGLTTALSVAQGGTGATSLTSNGVLLGNGTSAITSLTGSNGQCLVITAGAPTFTTCPGSGGVASINAQTGVVTIQGNDPSSVTTTSGSITINDATTALRGLASFNGTNFTVTSGAVNTVQNINTSAAPTFGQLTLTGTNTLALGTGGAGGNAGSAKFYDGLTSFAGTLNTTTLTANRTISLPDESGTICLQNSGNCGFLTGAAANGSYIQLQASTPGVLQTGNFRISGTGMANHLHAADIDSTLSTEDLRIGAANAPTIYIGRAGVTTYVQDTLNVGTLQVQYVDTGSAAPLYIGTTTANAINIGRSGVKTYFGDNINAGAVETTNVDRDSSGSLDVGTSYATNINVGNANSNLYIGSAAGTSGLFLQAGSGNFAANVQGGGVAYKYDLQVGGTSVFTLDQIGRVVFQPLANDNGAFRVLSVGGANVLNVDTANNLVAVNYLTSVYGMNAGPQINIDNSGPPATYITPLGTSLQTRINVPNYDPGAYNQIIAMGLPSTAHANARIITLLDARSSVHQPTIAVLSPNESQVGGFSWDGNNTTFKVKTSSDELGLLNSAGLGLKLRAISGLQVAELGEGSGTDGVIQFNNATNGNYTGIKATNVSASYITNLPTAIGTAGQCLTVSSVSGAIQQLDYSSCLSSSTGVQLQATTPGTAQTGNLNISGTGIFGTGLQTASLDQTTAGTLSLGTATATGVTIGSTTNTTAVLLQGAAGATYTIGTANNTGGITLGNSTATNTINVGNGNVATGTQTVNIGTGASGTGKDIVTVGSTNDASTLNLQAGTGNLNMITNSATASVIVKTNTNSATAFQVQNSAGGSIFNTNSTSGRVTIDGSGNNNGTTGYGLYFGDLFSGEGIGSKRTAGGNQNGLDFYTNGAASFQLTNNGTALFKNGINSTTAFQIQNASGTAVFTTDTSTSTITLGNSASGNYVTFTAAGGLQSFGTARPTKNITLSAEYAGAVLYGGDTGGANCSTNQNGTMTSGYDTSSSQQSYYNWTSSQATNQCFDVVVRVPLPTGFDGWAAAPNIQVKTDNASNSAYAIGIIKSDGSTYDTSYGSAYTSPGTLGTSWANMSTSSLDSTGYTSGGYMTIRIRMTAKNSANLQLGDIKLAYYSKY